MKKIVVSALTNNYSNPRSVVKYNKDWKYYMFVDSDEYDIPEPWEVIVMPGLEDRAPKMLTHKFFDDFDVMIWVDASVTLTEDPDLILQMMGENHMLVRRHTRAQNVFEDLNKCMLVGKVKPDAGIRVYAEYSQLPTGTLDYRTYAEMGFFMRRNNDKINSMMDKWAAEYHRIGIKRDQPAFARVVDPDLVKVIDPYKYKYVHVGYHTSQSLKGRPMKNKIHYINLLMGDKKVGAYMRETTYKIPKDHWICLTDADSLFLQSDDGVFLEKIVEKHPDTHIFGCMTNRQGLHYQVAEDHQFENTDMVYHYRTAQYMRQQYKTYSPLINIPVAGQFLLFPRWLMDKFPFSENLVNSQSVGPDIYFDWDFCKRVLEAGGKIRLIKGLYRYHYYRSHKSFLDSTHLKP